jgi:hypothetical protein
MPRLESWNSHVRLSQYESWPELEISPIFQQHIFTEAFIKILKSANYANGAANLKVILVEAINNKGEKTGSVVSSCISMKVPRGNGVNSGKGLLVYERPVVEEEEQAPVDGVFGKPLEPQLVMNIRNKVMSITSAHVRLCPSDRLTYSYAWGEFDRRYPDGYLATPPAEDLESLGHLAP